MAHLLEVNDLHYHYGEIHAVRGVSFYVDSGEIVTLIGANGSGKSTVLNTIAGLTKPNGTSGQILFNGKNIARKSGHSICSMGIMTVIEGRHVFSQMTVEENLALGAFRRKDTAQITKDINEMYNLFPKLFERKNQMAGSLSGGEQQMLAIARALVNKPELMLLDEPSLGLAPIVVEDIFKTIKEINREFHTTVLLVEQNSKLALKTASRGYILQNGIIAFEGSCDEFLKNDVIKKAYLGIYK